ncbi:hypothetical protein KKH15_02760, partial [Patescibacteria group bacterium]|nr:hypothetical protein [Patescibacteria group bacterium]
MKRTFLILAVATLVASTPFSAYAANTTSLEVSGWIPYWRVKEGTADARKHLSQLTEINPFAYSVKADGTLYDNMKIGGKDWQRLFKDARKKDVRIIPTIMWSDSANIHAILSNPAKRAAHIKAIVAMVEENDFEGVDIDYENKKAETINYFSVFLKELDAALQTRLLMCTIESRTPLSSRYTNPPATMQYANDFVEINKYCDRVRMMMYDQSTIDIKLNAAADGPYTPLSDVAWVEKVVGLAAQDIAKDKLVIAVPTYGYEFELTQTGSRYTYKKLWSFNPKYATDLAKKYRVKPERNGAGELSFEYTPKKSTTTNIVWWSDAVAIGQKVDLAKRLGVRGVALFKIDGSED